MKTISPNELKNLLLTQPGLSLIDVRTPAEYGQAHIAEAHNFPLDTLAPKSLVARGLLPAGDSIYILCQSGKRATVAAEKFAKDGIDDAVVVTGGTQAWVEAGYAVERDGGKTISLERQVRIAAGALVVTGIVLSFLVHPWFIGLSAFVGCGLVFAGITDWCGMALVLAKAPWNQRTNPS